MFRSVSKLLLGCSCASNKSSLQRQGVGYLLTPSAHARAVSAAVEGALSLVAVMGFVLGFACGSGPVPWIYLSEVLPAEIKGPAAALCTSLNWISNLAVGLTFPSMLAALHLGGAYSVYAVRLTACLRNRNPNCATTLLHVSTICDLLGFELLQPVATADCNIPHGACLFTAAV